MHAPAPELCISQCECDAAQSVCRYMWIPIVHPPPAVDSREREERLHKIKRFYDQYLVPSGPQFIEPRMLYSDATLALGIFEPFVLLR